MKKTLLLIFIGAVILAAAFLGIVKVRSASVTLYDCYNQLGKPWTSVFERASDAAYYGIWQYRGTADQNTKLVSYMCPNDGMVGYSVATGYEKNLRATITGSQSTIPVTSLTLKDGTALDIDVLGGKVFLTLEPGSATREEIVMCEGINTSSLNFTSCTRGLAFSGTSTAAVTANQKSHSAGSKVVMSNVHYVYEQYADVNNKDQILAGNKTWTGSALFYSFPTVSSSAYTGLPTNDGQLATKYYVDTVGAGGFTAVNVSTTRGLSVDGSSPEKVGVNVSSSMGMAFDASGKLYQKVSSTKGIASDSNGIYLDTTQDRNWTGQHTFTATTTLATTTVTSLATNLLTIGGTSTLPLLLSNTTSLHYHNNGVVSSTELQASLTTERQTGVNCTSAAICKSLWMPWAGSATVVQTWKNSSGGGGAGGTLNISVDGLNQYTSSTINGVYTIVTTSIRFGAGSFIGWTLTDGGGYSQFIKDVKVYYSLSPNTSINLIYQN